MRIYPDVMKAVKILSVVFGILLLIPVLVLTSNRFLFSDKIPPDHILTIQQFKEWQPAYTITYKVTVNGETFYIVTGEYARTLPSSKSEYYFNSKGTYINWNKDPGDFITLPIIRGGKRIVVPIDDIGR